MRLAFIGAALLVALAGSAVANAPEGDRTGRFTLQPIDGGFLRMDTVTGDVSLCAKKGTSVACEPVNDDRDLQKELSRLNTENKALKAEIKRLEEVFDKDQGRPTSRAPKFEIPTEEDVDKALTYLERMFKKFRDKLKDFESGSGKGTQL